MIVSREAELENENLRVVMLNCFKDINLNIYDQDIKIVERIGIYDKKKHRWPRPVKIRFTNSDIRDQVLFFKLRLRHSTMNFKPAEKNE